MARVYDPYDTVTQNLSRIYSSPIQLLSKYEIKFFLFSLFISFGQMLHSHVVYRTGSDLL